MFARFAPARKAIGRAAAGLALLGLAACDAPLMSGGPGMTPGQPVQVALLLPQSDSGAAPVARGLENAARLALADLQGAEIDLRVYDTAGQTGTAAAVAQRAVDEGAGIILGPLYGEAANAAAVAVADEGVNVLSFSNNTQVAGGNLYVLGSTFENSANRLVSYASNEGTDDLAVLYTNNVAGQIGRNAIQSAAARNGARVVAAEGYDLNSESLSGAIGRVQPLVANGQADGLFLTDTWEGGLSVVLQLGPEQGLSPDAVQYMGLTRWDTRPDGFNLPGVEGAYFTMPDRSARQRFESRYQAAYGSATPALAELGFDGIAAIGALAAQGRSDALSARGLTQGSGFQGATGVFRLRPDGTNQRGLAVATVRNQQVVILDPAPGGFRGAGF
jgi:ABC-type branched-subunit amino acid transport system substrate-binding protein